MIIKSGVSIVGMKPEMVIGMLVVDQCYRKLGFDCVLTSGVEGTHSRGSLHYVGLAADFRTNHLTQSQKTKLIGMVSGGLSGEYDAILEKTHMHIEFQPK